MVSTLAGHTAFAIAARLTGWEKGAPGDWRQGPPLNQPLIPPSPSLLPTAVTGPKIGISGRKQDQQSGRLLAFDTTLRHTVGRWGQGRKPHISGRRDLGIPVHTHNCHSQECRCPHSCRCRCCYSWLPRSPQGRAGGIGYLWERGIG